MTIKGNTKYDWRRISELRAQGHTWDSVASIVGAGSGKTLSNLWGRRRSQGLLTPTVEDELGATRIFDVSRSLGEVQTISELVDLLEVDLDHWVVDNFRASVWPQGGETKMAVRANFKRDLTFREGAAKLALEQLLKDAREHAPKVYTRPKRLETVDGPPVAYFINVYDSHLGMLAWAPETLGEAQDLKSASADYLAANKHLLDMSSLYNVDHIVLVVGNDLLHVDGSAITAKGITHGGATAAGTPQDLDTRQAKLFTEVRRLLVQVIDAARQVARVRVQVVPGNHDTNQMYRIGEVLHAWYRHDDQVSVIYSPSKRSYYGWGKNAWMFTHGEEYMRQKDNLPLQFATECPADIWVSSTHREVLTGHWHKSMAGRYVPTADMNEQRGIRTRALPGLTATDAWHAGQGYKHRRTATAIAYRYAGGVEGLHEFNP